MNINIDFSCTLLKLERLKQNKGQKEVCYGICVPSYLSKIEHNQVTPDTSIMKQLFQRLGIEFYCEESFVKKYQEAIELYFEQLAYSLEKTTYQKLLTVDQKLNYSPLTIDWMIIKGFEGDKDMTEQLKQCKSNLTEVQLAYYNMLIPLEKETVDEVIPFYLQAYYILNNSMSLLNLMGAYFIAGQYEKVHEHADKCISLALEEGNTCNLAGCYELIGTAYACINAEDLMLPFYKRAIHLLQNTNWKDKLNGIYYNIGATLISSKKYDQALHYLNMVQTDSDHKTQKKSFLLNHKKAITLVRSSRTIEAQEYINLMVQCLQTGNPEEITAQIQKAMYEEVIYECRDNYLEDPNYVYLLEGLIDLLKQHRHKGYAYFYHDVLKEAYCRQRKYKKALALYE